MSKEGFRKQAEKFRALLEATPDAMLIVNQEGRIVMINSHLEKLFGYERERIEGQPVELLVPERYREEHTFQRSGFVRHAHSRPTGAGLELFALHRDGHEFPVEISLSPVRTEEGVLVMSAIRDVTARKAFERELREASRLKSEFLANMSHELRTPLNSIIGFSELLLDGKPGKLNDTQADYLGDVLSSARHLLHLINGILDLAKIEAGKMELDLQPCALPELVEEVCSVLYPTATAQHVKLRCTVEPGLAEAAVDSAKLRQILYNLVSNAIKFNHEAGRVEIELRRQGDKGFTVQVKDTGIGIRAEDMHRLFREFEQLETGTARQYGGTGLGLVLTRKLVELHRGKISVRSEFGRGSVFTVTLPLNATPE